MAFDSSKNKNVVAAAIADLTSAAGTAAAGTVDVTGTFDQTKLNANFATLDAKVNAILAALRDAGIVSSS